jgi:hypothetical protein
VQPEVRNTIDAPAAESGSPGPRPLGPFVYASGARPLEGYTIKRGVGQGGFGEIYYATSDAGKEVALKLVRRNLDVELRGIRQCLNLKHPNLLDLYDIRQDAHGDTWVVMEFVAGKCLEDVLAAHPAGLPLEETLAWVRGIGAGLAYLHQRGIVHRDLKPGNVFSEEGVVKIGDYGLSKFISCSRRSGHTESIGTVHYMAPEVATGRYGKEIDIYALGVMLYEMLTGRVPFEGESVGEVLMKHLTAQPDVSMLAEPYRGIVARSLEKDPARRFHNAGEMLAALGEPCWSSYRGEGTPPCNGGALGTKPPAAPVLCAEVVPDAGVPPERPPSMFSRRFQRMFPPGEEPIARGVRALGRKFDAAWAQRNWPSRILLLFPLLLLAPVAIYLSIPLAIAYLFYRFVRMLVLTPDPGPGGRPSPSVAASPRPLGEGQGVRVCPPPPARPAPVAPPAPPPPIPAIVLSARERFTELIGSLLTGAMAAVVMSVVMVVIVAYHNGTPTSEQCAWIVLVGIAGTWGVLVITKFCEGRAEDPVLRRFLLMILGLGLGLAAWLAADLLLVNLPPLPAVPALRPGAQNFHADGRPLPMAYMAVFGTLLLLLRWWRQTAPLRDSRVRLWSIAVSCLVAMVVAGVWDFPQPWLVMVAGVMSVSVQLASPWVPLDKRLHPQRKTVI